MLSPPFVVPAVRSWWSSSLCLCVHSFYSLGSVLQLLTLASSSCLSDGCFVVVVVGLFSGIWRRESHGRSPLRIFCLGVASSPTDAWPSAELLADALPSLDFGSPLWQMLCCQKRVDPLLGGCLAAMVAWSSLADVLPLLLLDASLSYQGGCFATTALSIFRQPLRVIFIAGSVVGLWC